MARTKAGERLKRQAEADRLAAEEAKKRACVRNNGVAGAGTTLPGANPEECQFVPPPMAGADPNALTQEESLLYVKEARAVNWYKNESGCNWDLLLCAPHCVTEGEYAVHSLSSCQKALKFIEVQVCHFETHGDDNYTDPSCEQCQAFTIYLKYHARVKRHNARMKQLRVNFKNLQPAVHQLSTEEEEEEDAARGVPELQPIPDVDGRPVQWEEVD